MRELDVKDMNARDRSKRKQTLKQKIARSEVLTAMDIRQARDLDLQAAFQTLATNASSN
jgi:ribonucleotide reductase alpha subunit